MKKTSYFVALGALFLIPIFPLIVANSYFFPFITGKAFYFRILVEIACAAWVVLAFLDAKYRPKFTATTIIVTLFAIIALIADLLGVNPIRSLWSNFERMEGWIAIIHLWAFYLVSTSIFGADGQGRKWWHRWFNTEILVAVIVAGYGLAQIFGWAAIHQGASRIDASLGNSAYMAVYMLINAGLAAYLFRIARMRKIANAGFLQWLYPILSVLFCFEVFETATRGTILGMAGGIMVALASYALFARTAATSRRWIAGGLVILVILIGGGIYAARDTSFVKNNLVLGRLTSISLSNTESVARLYIWNMALQGAEVRPILGWGQENFNYIFNAHYNPAMYGQEQWFDRAHSVFLDWLVASGIVGLLAYLSLYVIYLVILWKSELSVVEKSILTGLLAGYFVHNLFVFDNLASYVLFFGLLAFVNSFSEHQLFVRSRFFQAWNTREFSLDAVEYVVLPIILVLLIGVIYFFNVRPIKTNIGLIAALESCAGPNPDPTLFQNVLDINTYVANQEIREQLLSCAVNVITSSQVPGPTRQAFYELASNEIQNQVAATPKDARAYVLGGSFLDQIGESQQGLPLLEKAHELSPAKQTIDFELASSELSNGDTADALALLKQAYESAPGFDQARIYYASALVIAGQEQQAHALFDNDPSVFETAQMASAYVSTKQYAKSVAIYQNLAKANPTDVNTLATLAQLQYQAGMKSAAVQTLKQLASAHIELKDQIDAAIKQIQTGK